MKELPEPLKLKFAAIAKEITELETKANKPLGDKDQRAAQIQLHYLYQLRNNVVAQLIAMDATGESE